MTHLVVEGVGPMATVQDLGRAGFGRLGVTQSGAADRGALRLANRIVGNPASSAAIEILLGGLTIRADHDCVVAVTGAPSGLAVDGQPAPLCTAFELGSGRELAVARPDVGLRSYLAVRGGLDVPRVLGSASTDPTMGVGPPVLAPGQRLPVGRMVAGPVPEADIAAPYSPPAGELALRVVLGPRADWFTPTARATFGWTSWEVTSDLDRSGIRLAGPALARAGTDELPSEGVVRGSVQVPPSGQPLVFLSDHPTTGGYPVIAVVVDADTDALAQVRPGQRLRFIPRTASWL